MPPKKHNTSFQAHHVTEFGLQICKCAVGNNTTVVTTACRFWEVFGKEESKVGMKRGRSKHVKYFKAPFCKENYSSRHTQMHSTQWAEYRELEVSAKKSFFDIGTISSSQTTMHAFAAPCTPQVNVLIDKDIIDVIIGEMMFHLEDMDKITRACLLESFVPTVDSSEDAADADDVSRYAITITNTKQFQLVVQYLAVGLSFYQVTQVIMDMKEVLGIGSIGSCFEGIVSRYARFICAMNLQCIAKLLQQC
jgi:hypothetical protein